jgi:hypothetical protein
MVRRGPLKLVVDRIEPRFELFDLGADPLEQHDLVSARGEEARALGRELKAFLERAVVPERIAPPSTEEQRKLEALGYGGGADDGGKDG